MLPRRRLRALPGARHARTYLRTGPDVRRAISRRVPLDELREVSLAAGLVPMRDAALELVARGLVPLSELPVVLPAERMAPERVAPRR